MIVRVRGEMRVRNPHSNFEFPTRQSRAGVPTIWTRNAWFAPRHRRRPFALKVRIRERFSDRECSRFLTASICRNHMHNSNTCRIHKLIVNSSKIVARQIKIEIEAPERCESGVSLQACTGVLCLCHVHVSLHVRRHALLPLCGLRRVSMIRR